MSAALALPIGLAVLAALVLAADLAPAEGSRRGAGALTVLGLSGLLAATFVLPEGDAFSGRFRADAFTVFVQRLVLAAGALAALGTIDHADRVFPRRQSDYYVLMLCSLTGMSLLAGARDLLLIAVAFELMGVPLYAMAAFHKESRAGIEGATKLFLTGAVSSGLTLYGLSFLVGLTGSTLLADLARAPASPLLVLGALLALAGMGYKVGAVPFHFWVPDTYASAPTPFVAFLSVAPKAAGVATLFRLLHEGLPHLQTRWMPLLLLLAAVTMVLGNLLAIPQTRVRRLLAYSGIAHVGLLLLGLALMTSDATGMVLFYLATYVFGNIGAFLVAEVVTAHGGEDLSAWDGLGRRAPFLALAMLLFLLSLGGIPFVAGFWGKILLFWAAWLGGQRALVVLGALLAVVSLFYYLKVARRIYVAPPTDHAPLPVGRATAAAISLALLGILGLGLLPRPFVESAQQAGRAVARAAVAVDGR